MPLFEVTLTQIKRTTQRVEADTETLAMARAQSGHPGWLSTTARQVLKGNGDPKPDDELGPVYPNFDTTTSA